MSYLRRHALGIVALCVALSGTAYAAARLPANSVGTRQITAKGVTRSDLATSVRAKLATGPRGRAGLVGPTGPRGAAGRSGARGPEGLPGAPGQLGDAGAQGPSQVFASSLTGTQMNVTHFSTARLLAPGAYDVRARVVVTVSTTSAAPLISCFLVDGPGGERGDVVQQYVANGQTATFVLDAAMNLTPSFGDTAYVSFDCSHGFTNATATWSHPAVIATRIETRGS